MKKAILFLCLLAIVIGGVASVLLYRSGQYGASEVEQWIGSQLQEIANSYLNPHLSFDDLDYQYPGTVTLKNLKLQTDDAATGSKITILGAANATITLAEIPSVGKPIVIERITLDHPEFRAVSIVPHSVQFCGFSNLLRSDSSATSAPAEPTTQASPPRKLSDYFRMKKVELIDGSIVYDPRIAGTDPMFIDKVTTRLDLEPSDAGLYRVKCDIKRDPFFSLLIDGSLNLDTLRASNTRVTMTADLSADKIDFLPPQLQKLLRNYEAHGVLSIELTGDMPLMDPLKGDVTAKALLTNAFGKIADYRVPIDQLSVEASLRDSKATISMLKIAALDGEANLSGEVQLNELKDAVLNLDVHDMNIRKLLSAAEGGPSTQLAGKVNLHLQAAAPAAVVLAKWQTPPGKLGKGIALQQLPDNWGQAQLRVSEGNLLVIPALRELNGSIHKMSSMTGSSSEPSDKLEIDAAFSKDRIAIKDLKFASNAVVARGHGRVDLDHTIDLILNGGPLEKVESKLGEFGKIIGAFTDSIAAYHVTGTLENASVSVEVGEKAVTAVEKVGGAVTDGVGKGIEKIGEGIEKILGK